MELQEVGAIGVAGISGRVLGPEFSVLLIFPNSGIRGLLGGVLDLLELARRVLLWELSSIEVLVLLSC